MPSIAQFKENSIPVVFTRFGFILTCQVYVERMTPKNTVLAGMEEAGENLTNEKNAVIDKHRKDREVFVASRIALENPETLADEAPKAPKPKRGQKTTGEEPLVEAAPMEAVTNRAEQIQKLDDEFVQTSKQFEDEINRLDLLMFQNACARVSHLLKSWDLTGDTDEPVPTDAQTIEATFGDNPDVLMGWPERTGEKDAEGQDQFEFKPGLLALMEAARFGPLGIAPTIFN